MPGSRRTEFAVTQLEDRSQCHVPSLSRRIVGSADAYGCCRRNRTEDSPHDSQPCRLHRGLQCTCVTITNRSCGVVTLWHSESLPVNVIDPEVWSARRKYPRRCIPRPERPQPYRTSAPKETKLWEHPPRTKQPRPNKKKNTHK